MNAEQIVDMIADKLYGKSADELTPTERDEIIAKLDPFIHKEETAHDKE